MEDQSFAAGQQHSERKSELEIIMKEFDEGIKRGNLPTVEEFKQACKNRAELVRCNILLLGNWGKESLMKEAERLEKAATGNTDELAAEALMHSETYRSLKEGRRSQIRRLRSQESGDQEIAELALAEDGWKHLAETVKETA